MRRTLELCFGVVIKTVSYGRSHYDRKARLSRNYSISLEGVMQMTKKLKAATMVLAALLVAAPMYAGSAVVGSVAGSLNATVGGQALVPNTVIFSGDSLQVKDGAAVIALENGNRMAFGRETEASFLRETGAVEVVLGHGDVSMYQADQRTGLKVKAGDYEVEPAGSFKTLGEVAMLNGVVTVTSKEGTLRVAGAGRTVEVAQGKTLTLGTKTARAPQTGGSQKLSGDTATLLSAGALAAGVVAAILAGISISRADDAKSAAEAANSTAATAASNASSAASAASAADSDAIAAGNVANLDGCALDVLVEEVYGVGVIPSPYVPPAGFSCQ
jgi:hypothetical protein